MRLVICVGVTLAACDPTYTTTVAPPHCGTVGTEVWGRDVGPHEVSCSVTVDGSLLVGPGAEVVFRQGAKLTVKGEIEVAGTADRPVVFRGEDDDATWGGVDIVGGGRAELRHVQIDGGGLTEEGRAAGLTVRRRAVTIEDVEIFGSEDCGLYVTETGRLHGASHDITVRDNLGPGLCMHLAALSTVPWLSTTSSGNGQEGVGVLGSPLTGHQEWEDHGLPYLLADSLAVDGGSLVLHGGVRVQMAPDTLLVVRNSGELTSLGSADAPVVLTSSDAFRGGWVGLVSEGGDLRLVDTVVEHGGGDGRGGISVTGSTDIFAERLTVRTSAAAGLYLDAAGAFMAGSNGVRIEDSARAAVTRASYLASFPPDTTLFALDDPAIEVTSPAIRSSATWWDLGAVYDVTGDLTVWSPDGVTPVVLTLDAGVTVEMSGGARVAIAEDGIGGLVAAGTPDEPVVFTSATPVTGAWAGMTVYGSALDQSLSLEHTRIEWGGASATAGALNVSAAVLTARGLSISGGAGYGFRFVDGGSFSADSTDVAVTDCQTAGYIGLDQAASVPDAGAQLTGNVDDAVVVGGSGLVTSGTWGDLGVPYRAVDGINVTGRYAPAVLDLEPGVEIQFGAGKTFRVGTGVLTGTLRAVGTASDPIVLGSVDGAPGSWTGVSLDGANDASILDYFEIADAGGTLAGLYVKGSSPTIDHGYIHDSACWGLYIGPDAAPDVGTLTWGSNACGDLYDVRDP